MRFNNKYKVTQVHMPNGEHVPVDKAFNVAISFHQAGKIIRAADIYHRIIKILPNHADALHLLGVTKRQQGKLKEAVKLIKSAIKINPGASMYYSNLSGTYCASGKFAEASTACMKALKLEPELPEIHLNLGAIAFAQEYYGSAIASYKKALSLKPGYIDALIGLGDSEVKSGQIENGLINYQKILTYQPDSLAALTRVGITLRMLDRMDEAIAHYKKSISRLPDEPDLYNNLALLYQLTGNNKEAAISLRKLLELTPDDEAARHMLHALDGSTPDSAPAEYVRDVFDNYADSFEAHLVDKLGYQTPELLAQAILGFTTKRTNLAVLDLGCGTGLMGVMLQDYSTHLAGVDLAPKMIEQARNKGIYHDLAVGDVVEFMRDKDDASYDIIVAADVFVYIGELKAIFTEAKRLLPAGGLFAFSVEATDDESANFVLNKTGRYGHSKKYLQELQSTYGFIEKHYSRAHIRNQNGQPVYGYLCVYQLP